MTEFTAWLEKNKTLWTRVYDEVIAPDLEEEWENREARHKKELRQQDEKQQILSKHISNEVAKNAHLAAENEQLKNQIQGWNRGSACGPGHETVIIAKSTLSGDEFRQLRDKYSELSKKYQDVSQKIKYLERKNKAVMQKNKDMKDSVRAWQEYADRQSGKQKPKSETRTEDGRVQPPIAHHFQDDRPHIPSSPGSVATFPTPRSLADISRSSPAPMLPLPRPAAESTSRLASPKLATGDEGRSLSASVTPKPQGSVKSNEQQHLCVNDHGQALPPDTRAPTSIKECCLQTHLHPVNQNSSQTTEDESTEYTRHAHASDVEDEDDSPQFVSTRSLKRKRDQPSRSKFEIFADRLSDGTPAKPFRVKEELLSSPPTTSHKMLRKDTFDLDDPAPKVLQTPRRSRRKLSIELAKTGTPRQQRSNSAPFTQGIKRENLGRLLLADVPRLDPEVNEAKIALSEVRASSETSLPEDILRSLDPNILGSAPEESPNKRSKLVDVKRRGAYGILIESGEESPVDENELRLPPHPARAQFSRRLDSSANPYPETPAKDLHHFLKAVSTRVKLEQVLTPPSSASHSADISSGDKESHNIPSKARSKPDNDSTLDERPIWTLKTHEARLSARKERVSPLKQARLRDKPVKQLTIQDFKPNPAYNQGYTYAFSETVRKRGDRMCLPGCTNPRCCGSTFRVLAEAQASLSISQEEALLENYLGDAYNTMQLTQVSSEERKELVLQARTKKMAKETGKHREAYERRRTPPGFWRVDFPTTQEQLADRERAKEQEKKVVQDRWLEAQRKGGKWIFRDE